MERGRSQRDTVFFENQADGAHVPTEGGGGHLREKLV